ncbi:type II secretion system F family protein [Candidatus Woesearchaeota archaeon]|nr:type II secretion system F family protein [Candidatus Woesearchaeota archaeon]
MIIPFSILPEKKLNILSKKILGISSIIAPIFPYLGSHLKNTDSNLNTREYLAVCMVASSITFLFLFIISSIILFLIKIEKFLIISFVLSLALSLFVFIQQTIYPKLVSSRKIAEIDRNLLPALRNIMIKFNSGIPIFDTIVSISKQNFGQISEEFKQIVKKINSGASAVEAIEESATKNPSLYYRRALWQISNGMKAGSDISIVLQETINNLSTEQIIQIENYGSQLSPLAMFYMIIAIILPALAMTMLIILSSFLAIEPFLVKILFYGLYVVILFFQIMFLGMLKTRRPNLLSN